MLRGLAPSLLFPLVVGLLATTAASELPDADPAEKKLMGWFNRYGGKAPGTAIRSQPPFGRGVFCTKAMDDMDVAFSIPQKLLLSRETAMAAPEARLYGALPNDECIISMYLLVGMCCCEQVTLSLLFCSASCNRLRLLSTLA